MFAKQILGIVLALGLAAPVLGQSKTPIECISQAIPTAAADAMTLDLPLAMALATMTASGILSGPTFSAVPAFFIGAFVGQTLRKSCRDYTADGKPSVFCGLVGGVGKYGMRSAVLGKSVLAIIPDMIRGSIDVGNYERQRASLIEMFQTEDYANIIATVFQNELFNEAISVVMSVVLTGSYKADANSVKVALLVPTLLSIALLTTNNYAGQIADFIASLPAQFQVEFEKNKEEL